MSLLLYLQFLHDASPGIITSNLSLSQWDEALLTMSKGEMARLEIEPEWAYGKKGLPESKYPFPLLIFVVPLIQVMLCLLMVGLRDQYY